MAGSLQLFLVEPSHFHACWLLCDWDSRLNPRVVVTARPDFDLKPFQIWCADLENAGVSLPERELVFAADPLEPVLCQAGPKVAAIAGQNELKANRVAKLLQEGVPVLCDKPLWTDPDRGRVLIESLTHPRVPIFLDDLMTEAGEPAFVLQREVLKLGIGELQMRPRDSGRIRIHLGNHHHLVKTVGGITVRRDASFLDWQTYGDPFADVGVHLVDVLFGCLASAMELQFGTGTQIAGRVETRWVPLDRESLAAVDATAHDGGEGRFVRYPLSQTWNGEGSYQGVVIESSWAAAGDTEKPEGQFCAIPVEAGGLVAMKTSSDPCICLHLVGIPVSRRADYLKPLEALVESMPEAWSATQVEITRYGVRMVPDPRVRVGHPLRFPKLLKRFLDKMEAGTPLSPMARQALIEKYRISAGSPRT